MILSVVGIFGYAYADFDQLSLLLPDEKDLLDSGWKMGEIKSMKAIEIPYSDSKPDVLLRQYGIISDNGSKSTLKVTMNVYEFPKSEDVSSINIKYASKILSDDYKQIRVSTLSNDYCYEFIFHETMKDEKSTISCNVNNFLITVTAEQNGEVYLKGNHLTTSIVAEGFAKFSLTKTNSYMLPSWIKNNASWWSQNKISDDDFAKGLEYMINQGIINVPTEFSSEKIQTKIPSWIKNNAAWWAQNKLSDTEFLKSIQYLVNTGIIKINSKV